MTRDDIMNFLRAHKNEMQSEYGVAVVGLFGSYARQSAHDDSDIDILVEFQSEKKTLRNFFGFKHYLEEHLGKRVDLGLESALKPVAHESIKNEVLYA